jgi:hypothetical protein
MTLQPLEQICFQESISYSGAFPVRTYQLRAVERAWQESEAGFFTKLSDLPKKLNQYSFFLKMYQQSGQEDLMLYSKNLPRSGMIADGQLYQPEALEPVTFVKGGSFLDTPTVSTASYRNQKYPTPTANSYGRNKSKSDGASIRLSLHGMATRGILPGHPTGSLSPEWQEQAMGYRTGWTEIDAVVIQWFGSRSGKRSKSLRGSSNG